MAILQLREHRFRTLRLREKSEPRRGLKDNPVVKGAQNLMPLGGLQGNSLKSGHVTEDCPAGSGGSKEIGAGAAGEFLAAQKCSVTEKSSRLDDLCFGSNTAERALRRVSLTRMRENHSRHIPA